MEEANNSNLPKMNGVMLRIMSHMSSSWCCGSFMILSEKNCEKFLKKIAPKLSSLSLMKVEED